METKLITMVMQSQGVQSEIVQEKNSMMERGW